MPERWQSGAAGVCIPVKLLLTGRDTLNDCFCYRSRVNTVQSGKKVWSEAGTDIKTAAR